MRVEKRKYKENREVENMNLKKITIEDAMEMYEEKGMVAIIKNGQVVGFEVEE